MLARRRRHRVLLAKHFYRQALRGNFFCKLPVRARLVGLAARGELLRLGRRVLHTTKTMLRVWLWLWPKT